MNYSFKKFGVTGISVFVYFPEGFPPSAGIQRIAHFWVFSTDFFEEKNKPILHLLNKSIGFSEVQSFYTFSEFE